MQIAYAPCTNERLALITVYCGLDKSGKPDIELVEEPIALWRVEENGNEIVLRPLVAGYQHLDAATVRIAVDSYDGRVIWGNREFESREQYLADCSAWFLHLQTKA